MSTVNIFKVGMKVMHGSSGYENEEIIKCIVDYSDCKALEFESQHFTYVPNDLDFDCDGKAQYYRYFRPGGCEDKSYETISIVG